MGRKKIQISRITDERNRQVTFNKRKFGVMKKAYELSVLCDCEIALIIFSSSNKLYQYASTDMDKVLLKYTEYNEPHESLTNKNIIEALSKKESKGGMDSPLGDDSDHEGDFSLTPRTEAKYNKIDEEFHLMMQRNQLNGARGGQSGQGQGFSMPVTVPVNSSFSSDSVSLLTSPQPPQPPVSPRPPSHEVAPHNGYQQAASPAPGPASPGPGSLKRCAASPDPQQLGLAMNRNSLRVVIPASARDTDLGLDYGNSNHGHNFQSGEFMELPLQHWNQTHLQQNSHNIPQLSVSGSSPPPAGARVSPHLASVKSEPMSPRHPAQHGAGDSLHGPRSHLSPGDALPVPSPGSHCVSPGPPEIHIHQVHQMEAGYEAGMPLQKRLRVSDSWTS